MAINALISDCYRALENLLPAARDAHDAAAADRDHRMALLDSGDIQAAASDQEDIMVMVEEVRQSIEVDKQLSDAAQQELDRAQEEWRAALDTLQELVSGDG